MMNWKFLAVPLAVPAVFLISSSALTGCEVCTGEDCPDFGGGGLGGLDSGGDTGGSGGGATSGGTGGTGQGGMGGESLVIECADTASGTAGTCEPDPNATGDNLDCQQCIESKCCAEQEACFAYEPEQACGWGSVLYDGVAMSEASCMLTCLDDLEQDPDYEFLGVQEDLEVCSAQCGAVECATSSATEVTKDLAGCILGTRNDEDPDNDDLGCQVECGLL